MRILITHGYLLTGTGSNLYVNNLVRELCKKGHDVMLVCQDFDPIQIDFVNRVYGFNSENSEYFIESEQESEFEGKCFCFRPNLNGFLPVYVYDHYEGFEVKEFPDCTDEEVQAYNDNNRNALDLICRDFDVDVVNTNHLVLFPWIATQLKEKHGFRHIITVHGSALNFTVKKDKRFENFAVQSLKKTDEIVVDSLHADDELKEFLDEVQLSELKQKIEIIPAGVDIESFIVGGEKTELIAKFCEAIKEKSNQDLGRTTTISNNILECEESFNAIIEKVDEVRKSYDYRYVDQDVIQNINNLQLEDNNVMFVGKYLWTKGIYLIINAIPNILKENPNTNFFIVGFGPFREVAEVILNYVSRGKSSALLTEIKSGHQLFNGDGEEVIPLIVDILEKHSVSIDKIVGEIEFDIKDKVVFTGIAAHAELVHLLPAMDVLIAPSVFPEAFGMVAIEAMACGVYPVVTYQSAFREIADQLKEIVKDDAIKVEDVLLNEDASLNISKNVNEYLRYKKDLLTSNALDSFKMRLRKLVVDHYSWEGIAKRYLKSYAE